MSYYTRELPPPTGSPVEMPPPRTVGLVVSRPVIAHITPERRQFRPYIKI